MHEMVERRGIEPRFSRCKRVVIPLYYRPMIFGVDGLAPTTMADLQPALDSHTSRLCGNRTHIGYRMQAPDEPI